MSMSPMIQPYPPQYNPQYNPAMPPQYPGLPPGASVNAGMPNPAMAYMQNNTAAPPAPMDYGVNQLLQGLPQQNPYGAGPMANFNSVDQGLGVPQPAFVVPPQGSMYSQQPPMAPGYPQQQYAPQNMQPQPLMMPYPQQQVPPQIQQDPMIPYFGAEAMPPEVPSNESLGAPESGLGAEAEADPFADMDLDELMKMLSAGAPPESAPQSMDGGMPVSEVLPTPQQEAPQPQLQAPQVVQEQPVQQQPVQPQPMALPPMGNMVMNAPAYPLPMMAPPPMSVTMMPPSMPIAYPPAPPVMMSAPPAPVMAPPMGMPPAQPTQPTPPTHHFQ